MSSNVINVRYARKVVARLYVLKDGVVSVDLSPYRNNSGLYIKGLEDLDKKFQQTKFRVKASPGAIANRILAWARGQVDKKRAAQPVYKNVLADQTTVPCPRCKGEGYFPQWDHIAHGVCFRCNGEGTV